MLKHAEKIHSLIDEKRAKIKEFEIEKAALEESIGKSMFYGNLEEMRRSMGLPVDLNLEEDLFRVERSVEDLELNITVVEEADGIYSNALCTIGEEYKELKESGEERLAKLTETNNQIQRFKQLITEENETFAKNFQKLQRTVDTKLRKVTDLEADIARLEKTVFRDPDGDFI